MSDNILSGPEPIVNYPEQYLTLGHFILDNLIKHGNALCMIDAITKEEFTYKQILERTIQAANTLKSFGLMPGDAIAICSENHIKFFVPVIAAFYLGLTIAPINHNYTATELQHCLKISKPKAVFCSNAVLEKFLQLRGQFKCIQHIVTLDHTTDLRVLSFGQFLTVSQKVYNIDEFRADDFNPKDNVAYILCSSGTTGLPKGVMLTHHNILIGLSVANDPRFEVPQASFLAVLPLFHVYGLTRTFIAINQGSLVIILKKFELNLFLQTIQDYKITNLMLVPPILVLLAKTPLLNKYDLSSIQQIGTAAAPLGKDIEDAVKQRFTLKGLVQGYGMTEIAAAALKTPNDNERSGTVGHLMPFLECKVCDLETGKALSYRIKGELCFKGPQIMKGYCDDVNATAQCIDEEGWLHTGDIGYYDERGYFYIVDRIKELIKYKGFQVAPAELEQLLLNNPCIRDAAVIGKPDELAGELPLALVVKEPGRNTTGAQIQQFIAKQVSPQKRLHGGVLFVEEIPRNPSGKILRRKLRELLRNKSKL